jgi:hypothetical protein
MSSECNSCSHSINGISTDKSLVRGYFAVRHGVPRGMKPEAERRHDPVRDARAIRRDQSDRRDGDVRIRPHEDKPSRRPGRVRMLRPFIAWPRAECPRKARPDARGRSIPTKARRAGLLALGSSRSPDRLPARWAVAWYYPGAWPITAAAPRWILTIFPIISRAVSEPGAPVERQHLIQMIGTESMNHPSVFEGYFSETLQDSPRMHPSASPNRPVGVVKIGPRTPASFSGPPGGPSGRMEMG